MCVSFTVLRNRAVLEKWKQILWEDTYMYQIVSDAGFRLQFVPRATMANQETIRSQDPPKVLELSKKEPPVPLLSGVLEDLIGVDFVEGVVLEGQGQRGEIPDDIRLAVRVDVQPGH